MNKSIATSIVFVIFVTQKIFRDAKLQIIFAIRKHLSEYLTQISVNKFYLEAMEQESINERIRYIIEREGHTVSSFAKKIDIANQTIRSITNDRNKPSYDIIVKIIEGFEWVDANWLVMGQKSEIDIDKKSLYSIIETQQKTIESQQKTIDRLTEKLVQDLPDKASKKMANAG